MAKKRKISVEPLGSSIGDGYRAKLVGTGWWDKGETAAEAIGNLFLTAYDEFPDIEIKVSPGTVARSESSRFAEDESGLKKFKLHWLDNKVDAIEGTDITDAFRRSGYGQGALRALDYWEEVDAK